MAFLDNLGEIISERGKEAAGVAKKVAEIANLKGQINGIETEIKKNYRKIGEAYYETYKDAEVTCEFEEFVQVIRDAKKAVEELKRKVSELKGDVACPECGNQMKAGSSYCSKCGTKVEEEYFDDEDGDEVAEHVIIDEDEPIAEEMLDDEVEELEEVEDIEG